MTREEAIKVLQREKDYVQQAIQKATDGDGYVSPDGLIRADDYVEACTEAISALRQQGVPGKDVGKWISVKDRLPEQTDPAKKVLFITKTDGVFIGCYYKATAYDQFNGWYSMCVRIDNVTHWMPLPEPPEEGTV